MLGEFDLGLYTRLGRLKAAYDAHAAQVAPHGASSALVDGIGRLVLRDSNGRAEIGDPSNPSHIANKGYVDFMVSGAGAGTVTQVNSGTGLTGGPITTTGTLSLSDTGVSPGTYTLANITIDAKGRITAAANGTAVSDVTVSSPLTRVVTGTSIALAVQTASSSLSGVITSSLFQRITSFASVAGGTTAYSVTDSTPQILDIGSTNGVGGGLTVDLVNNRITNNSGTSLTVLVMLAVQVRNTDAPGSRMALYLDVCRYNSSDVSVQSTASAINSDLIEDRYYTLVTFGTITFNNGEHLRARVFFAGASLSSGLGSPYGFDAGLVTFFVKAL